MVGSRIMIMRELFPTAIFTSICLASSFSVANEIDAFTVCPAKEIAEERLACFDEYTRHRTSKLVPQLSLPISTVLNIKENSQKYIGADIAGLSNHDKNRLSF